MDVIEEFYNMALEFCRYIETTTITYDNVEKLMTMLMNLYVKALKLPHNEPETEEEGSNKEVEDIYIDIKVPDFYNELFDPFADEEIVGCSLTDDLGDIRKDLMEGINEYEASYKNNASFEWRLGLDNHWGKHATDVLRALHILRTKGKSLKRPNL